MYSGPGDINVVSGHTYYWQVRIQNDHEYADGGAWWSFSVTKYPVVSSITREHPSPTSADYVSFTVTFSEEVSGVDKTDFTLTTTGSITGESVIVLNNIDDIQYIVTVMTGTDDGTIRLDVNDSGTNIEDGDGDPLLEGFTEGEVYTVDKTPPEVTAVTLLEAYPVNRPEVTYKVEFSEEVTGVDITDFEISETGITMDAALDRISSLVVTETEVYTYVTVNTGNDDGTIRLDVKDAGTEIVDQVGFELDGGFDSGDIHNVTKTGMSFEDEPTRWTSAFDYNHGWRVSDHPRMFADVDGDGNDDAVGFGLDGVYVALSDGSSSFEANPTKWTSAFDYNHGWRVSDHPRMLADVNGDGMADAVGFGLNSVYVALSDGSSFTADASWWTKALDYNHGWRVSDHPRMFADVDGDGSADAAGFGLDGVYIALAQ